MSLFDQIRMYSGFALGLRQFLKEPITLEQSHRIIRQRLQNREKNLLTVVKRVIYENQSSPYLNLLKLAGCEFGDFELMVRSDGIEPTLTKLSEQGVYVSLEEFKGKKEMVRGSKSFKFEEKDFDNPFLFKHLEASSSATRSAGTRTVYDFDFITANLAVYRVHMIDAYGLDEAPLALWYPIMPGAGPIMLLTWTKAGKTPVKWFSPVDRKAFKPSFKNRMGTNYIVYVGRMFGSKWPRPEHISPDDAWRVARWMADAVKEQGGCCLNTYPSAAVRVCQAAKERGLDIAGAKFVGTGEPITKMKKTEIESVGAQIYISYGFTEAGFVSAACPKPIAVDDTHFLKDCFALIQRRREVLHAKLSVDAFLCTTLLPSTPKVLLNVESGDYGVIETKHCGCKFEELGLTDHIYNIRGFDRLTAEGMTFIGTDLVKIIEEVLPAKFGGASTDYQMLEEEDEKGHTRMSVLVSPEVGQVDEAELIGTILGELSRGKDTQRMMVEMWSRVGTLQVKRMRPFVTARGKLMPLHIRKGK